MKEVLLPVSLIWFEMSHLNYVTTYHIVLVCLFPTLSKGSLAFYFNLAIMFMLCFSIIGCYAE